jgi:hypothetical protein
MRRKPAGRGQKYTKAVRASDGSQVTGRMPFCGWVVYLPLVGAAAEVAHRVLS